MEKKKVSKEELTKMLTERIAKAEVNFAIKHRRQSKMQNRNWKNPSRVGLMSKIW